MSVIYIDLGCSDGVTVKKFLEGQSFLPDLAPICDKVYAFDPIRHPNWSNFDSAKCEFYECAVGASKPDIAWLAITDNPEARTLITDNQNYELPIKRKVKVLNFPEWLCRTVRFEDTVIVKMDIEGSEYGLLEALIRNRSILYINHLYTEFHSFCIKEDDRQAYIDREQRIRERCPIPIGVWG